MGDLRPFICQGCGDRFDDEHEFQLHIAKHGARDEQGNRVLPLRSVQEVMDRVYTAGPVVELAAQQARKLGEDIGMAPRDVDELEQKVRASAAVADVDDAQLSAELQQRIDAACARADAKDAAAITRELRRAAAELEQLEHAARAADAPAQVQTVSSWRCEKCGGTDRNFHCNVVVNAAPRITSVFDDLEAALRVGAVLDVAATPDGAIHAVMETEDGGQFAQATAPDLVGCWLKLVEAWKEAKPKPPPCCLKCHRELTGQLLGQHLNIDHAVPWCITYATERTRAKCIPPDAAGQLLQAAIRKQKAVQS